jgi:uridine kinase
VQPLLVGVSGGSGSGKTTLIRAIRDLRPADTTALSFDDYYRDQFGMAFHERIAVNYDHPDALDVELFTAHLAELRAGRAVALPKYDFARNTRSADTEVLLPAPVMLVDGILLLSFAEIRAMLDLMVYVDTPEEVRFSRRLDRDVAERGRTPASVHHQFRSTVAPMHDRYVYPSRVHAHLQVSGAAELLASVTVVLAAIDTHRPAAHHLRGQPGRQSLAITWLTSDA